MKKIKKGDYVSSKNDYEFNAKVVSVTNDIITVEYDGDKAQCHISEVEYDEKAKSFFADNWTFNF